MPVPYQSDRFIIKESLNPFQVYKIPKIKIYSKAIRREYEIYKLLQHRGCTFNDVNIGTCNIDIKGNSVRVNYLEMPRYTLDLFDYLNENKINEKLFLSIVYQLTKAVLILHTFKIVHRDVKLENFCFSTSSRKLYMIDFELSYKVHEVCAMGGTNEYMLPSRREKKYDYVTYYTDIVSLLITIGTMLYVKQYKGNIDSDVIPYYVDQIIKQYQKQFDTMNPEFIYFIRLFEVIDKKDWEELKSKGRIKFLQALRQFSKYFYY